MTETETLRARKSLELIFFDSKNGSSEEPTKLGFLALARAGKEVWNDWRRDSGANCSEVDFSDQHFESEMNFEGFEFGDFANFEKATFAKSVRFNNANFGSDANFTGTLFEDDASFDGTTFKGTAVFEGTIFSLGVSYIKARFDAEVNFLGALFGDESDFDGANFQSTANFSGVGLAVHRLRYGDSYPALKIWIDANDMTPRTFERISFRGCTFQDDVDFSNRRFQGSASWGSLEGKPVIFREAPLFHNCQLNQDTSFEDAVFPHPTGDDVAARAYRTLKLAFSDQQDIRQEQVFFKLEMAEEAARDKGMRRWFYRAYEWAADYGFSVGRPIVRLIVLPTLGLIYVYMVLMANNYPVLWTTGLVEHPQKLVSLVQFILLNLAPFPGFDETMKTLRESLFGKDSLTTVLGTLFEVIHKSLTLVGLFLAGLGIRNIFKMK